MSEHASDQVEMVAVDVYDATRLPHYGAVDYAEGAETPHLSAEELERYVAVCERYLRDSNDDEDVAREDYDVDLAARMTREDGETGDAVLTVVPGDLIWSGCPAAVDRCRR